ncbi:hypothetical protein DFH07DRAFT_19863 [Mycena maculata]|uniref:Uncharacterized protein n=1 Tax=Mycena maculata TaxID=230809 RepID=A0AAD7IK27_9AGAR|nr:hypothetical protein DFH07DRAFT_19863 [Mycena maculata]
MKYVLRRGQEFTLTLSFCPCASKRDTRPSSLIVNLIAGTIKRTGSGSGSTALNRLSLWMKRVRRVQAIGTRAGDPDIIVSLLPLTAMPLTVTQRAAANDFAHALFRWEVLIEEHGAVVRQDPNQYAIAYDEVERATTPESYTIPPREQWPALIRQLDDTLEPKATAFVDRLVNACFFMARLTVMMAAEDDQVDREAARIRAKLQDEHKFAKVEMHIPKTTDMHPLLVKRLAPVALSPALSTHARQNATRAPRPASQI